MAGVAYQPNPHVEQLWNALPGHIRLLLGLMGGGPTALPGPTPLTTVVPQAGLTRPWPGIYKGALSEGRTQPPSYASPKTYDLTGEMGASPLPTRSGGAPVDPMGAIHAFLNHPAIRDILSKIGSETPPAAGP